jgi:FMN phosphatase YigB (HAD superfamily)
VRFADEHRFDHIQIEGEHGFGKPEERAYTHAMETLGVGPHETWMVGDNLEWEIMAPQRLGIYAICTMVTVSACRPIHRSARPHHPPPVGIAAVAELFGLPAARRHCSGLLRAPPPARRPAPAPVTIAQP